MVRRSYTWLTFGFVVDRNRRFLWLPVDLLTGSSRDRVHLTATSHKQPSKGLR